MSLRASVREALLAHGITPAEGEAPEALRARLNDLYVDEVRRLRERQRAGEIALRDYAAHADALKQRFTLLGLPLALWEE